MSACGKGEPDGTKYADVCAKVVKCDAQFAAIPDGQKHCQNFFAGMESKLATVVPSIVECLNTTPCESLSFQACGAKHMQELKGLMP